MLQNIISELMIVFHIFCLVSISIRNTVSCMEEDFLKVCGTRFENVIHSIIN